MNRKPTAIATLGIRSSLPGVTLAEYCLIGLLMAGLVVVGLMRLGTSLNGNLDNLHQSMRYKRSPIVASAPAPLQMGMIPSPSIPKKAKNTPGTPAGTVTPAQTNNAIMVTGVNGATNLLSDTLVDKARQLLADGLITQEQANLLIDLSNQGHYLASAQKLFEEAVATGQPNVVFEGKTYTVRDFGSMITYNKSTTKKENWALDSGMSNEILKGFTQKYQDVLASGLLDNPEVKAQIDPLAMQIGSLADALVWGGEDVLTGKSDAGSYSDPGTALKAIVAQHFDGNTEGLFKQLAVTPVSNITNGNAGQICSVGAASDNGQQCRPGT